jgi:integrase
VIELVTEVSSGGPDAGHRVLKSLKTFFKWCVGQGIIDFSPAESVRSYWRIKSRDRVLTDEELAAVLVAARQLRAPYDGIIEVLALTGQRREEVAQMQWTEINQANRTWSIPAARSKNGRAHIVHLSEQAWTVIDRFPRTCAYVFATANRKRGQNIKVAKAAIDAASGVSGWRLHDLRRTVVSGMARLGVSPHVADKILNHQTGTISGVAAVYQRHEFMKERKEALDLWARHVAVLLRTAETDVKAA